MVRPRRSLAHSLTTAAEAEGLQVLAQLGSLQNHSSASGCTAFGIFHLYSVGEECRYRGARTATLAPGSLLLLWYAITSLPLFVRLVMCFELSFPPESGSTRRADMLLGLAVDMPVVTGKANQKNSQ